MLGFSIWTFLNEACFHFSFFFPSQHKYTSILVIMGVKKVNNENIFSLHSSTNYVFVVYQRCEKS